MNKGARHSCDQISSLSAVMLTVRAELKWHTLLYSRKLSY